MQTIFPDTDAAIAKRQAGARIKGILGILIFVVGFGGLVAVWQGLHTVFNYPAVWPLGLAITGLGFILDARGTFRTGKDTKGVLSLAGTVITCVGMTGPFIDKWTRTQAKIGIWPLLAPLVFVAAALLITGIWSAVKAAPSGFSKLSSRER